MRAENGDLSFSPSDVTAYLECEHLAQLELKVARGEIVKPRVEDAQAELIRRKGDEHERAYLAQLLADGRDVVTIEIAGSDGEWDWERAARETKEAMRGGSEVVYQAAFLDGEWRGLADFVIRGPDGSFEAYDTKLARHGKPAHVLQLCFYSEQIGRMQGRLPERLHIALGSGETESYRLLDFLAYYRRVRERFLDAVLHPGPTEPWPVDHCGICDFLRINLAGQGHLDSRRGMRINDFHALSHHDRRCRQRLGIRRKISRHVHRGRPKRGLD